MNAREAEYLNALDTYDALNKETPATPYRTSQPVPPLPTVTKGRERIPNHTNTEIKIWDAIYFDRVTRGCSGASAREIATNAIMRRRYVFSNSPGKDPDE